MSPKTDGRQSAEIDIIDNQKSQLGEMSLTVDLRDQALAASALDPVRKGETLLRRGVHGAATEELQRLLNQWDATLLLVEDGDFGPATERAVRQFQRWSNENQGTLLKVDGKVGKNTLAALDSIFAGGVISDLARSTPPDEPRALTPEAPSPQQSLSLYELRRGDEGIHVGRLQRLLNASGLVALLETDEDFGGATERAVRMAQHHLGLPATGIVDGATLDLLRRYVSERHREKGLLERLGLSDGPEGIPNPGVGTSESFQQTMKKVFRLEGGVNNNPNDSGNAGGQVTNLGVTQKVYDMWRAKKGKTPISTLDITKEEATQLYYEEYWLPGKCHLMPQAVAMVHMDACVNMGVRGASLLLQEAVGASRDGKIGPNTLEAVAAADARTVVTKYLDLREKFYKRLAKRENNAEFLNGWLNRVDELRMELGIKRRPTPGLAAITRPTDYGKSTKPAVTALQDSLGLPADGEIDPQLYEFLMGPDL